MKITITVIAKMIITKTEKDNTATYLKYFTALPIKK